MDVQGVHYSHNLNSFEGVLVSLFDKGILSTHSVPQLEKVTMLYSFQSPTKYLSMLLFSMSHHF